MIQETSVKAYFSEVYPTLGERQKIVLEAIERIGPTTNQELADYLHFPINTITPRVKELRDKKLVIGIGARQCRSTGRTAMAWKVNTGTLF